MENVFSKISYILREITEKNNDNLPYMYINENNNNEIYLMCGKQTNSYNWELYTYVLKCILQDKNLKYEPTIGRYKDKFLIYENSEKGINLKMYYDFEEDKYMLNEEKYENLDEIVTAFENYIKNK